MTVIGIPALDELAWLDVYFDDDLATGADDGTSQANAWQSLTSMNAGVKSGMRVNCKRTTTPVTTAATQSWVMGSRHAPIWYRGFLTTIGDSGKFQIDAGTDDFTFSGTDGATFMMDMEFDASNTDQTWQGSGKEGGCFIRCKFTNDGTADIWSCSGQLFIQCEFDQSATFSSGEQCVTLRGGKFVGCTFISEGNCVEINSSPDGFGTMFLHCGFFSTVRDCLRITATDLDRGPDSVYECTFLNGGDGIEIVGFGTGASGHEVGFNVYGCVGENLVNGFANTPNNGNKPWFHVGAFNSSGSEFAGFNNHEDVIVKTAYSAAIVTTSTDPPDYTPNATAGGGAVARDGGTVGYLAGSGTELYQSAFNFGCARHGLNDGEAPLGLQEAGAGAVASALNPLWIGILPESKTGDLS